MLRPFWATHEALIKPARALRLIGSTLVVSVVLGLIYVVAGLFFDLTDLRIVAVYALAGSVRDLIVTLPIAYALVLLVRSPVGPRTRRPALAALLCAALAVSLAAASNLDTANHGALGNPTALGLAAGAGVAGLGLVVALVLMLRAFAIELGIPELARLARGIFIAGGIVGALAGAAVALGIALGGAAWIAVAVVALVGGGVVLNRLLMLLHLLAGACETADGVAETFA